MNHGTGGLAPFACLRATTPIEDVSPHPVTSVTHPPSDDAPPAGSPLPPPPPAPSAPSSELGRGADLNKDEATAARQALSFPSSWLNLMRATLPARLLASSPCKLVAKSSLEAALRTTTAAHRGKGRRGADEAGSGVSHE